MAFLRELWTFCRAVFRNWIKTVGGELVAFYQMWYAIKYQEWPPVMSWVVLVGCFFVACFMAWREHYNVAQKSLREIGELKRQPLTGLQLRNACDSWIARANRVITRLKTEGAPAIPEAKKWLDDFPDFTAVNLPIEDHDKCNFWHESTRTFHLEKIKVDASWEPNMYASHIGHNAAMLMMFRKTIK